MAGRALQTKDDIMREIDAQSDRLHAIETRWAGAERGGKERAALDWQHRAAYTNLCGLYLMLECRRES